MNTYIVAAIYWVACCIIVYVLRNRNDKNPINSITKKKTKFWEHLLIVLLCPLAVPIILVALAFKAVQDRYYRNRPRPVSGFMKKYMKDRVVDENNHTVSIAEYNYKHGTEYTLDDVYGKGYVASLNEKEKSAITAESTKYGILEIQENIPETPYTEAARLLGNALLTGDFADFENLLDTNVEHISYMRETISRKDKVVEYWKGWRSRYVETKEVKKFAVVYNNNYSNACLLLERMVVMFYIKDNRIRKILLATQHLNLLVGYHDNMLDFPFDLNCIKHCLSELREPDEIFEPVVIENRIPCFSCGTPSEELEWHSSLFQFGDIGYSGIVSVCPHCHKVVEYYPETRIRYDEPVDPKKAKRPLVHRANSSSYSPKLFGIRNFEGGEPLKGTKYLEGLSGKTRQAAEESNWFLFHTMSEEDLERTKKRYYAALDDGIYEAANILGILAYNFEGKTEEGEKLLKKAVDGGSHNAMLNLFTVLWGEQKYEEAINLLNKIYENPSPSLKCLWNLAFFHYMGSDYAHNPIRTKDVGMAKNILMKILEKEGDAFYTEENSVVKGVGRFLKYIEEGNIFASKGGNYHWRIKTNIDSLKQKGDDAAFWDLDSLSLEEGHHLGLRVAVQQGMGDESNFYVYDKDGKEDKDLLKYINVDETAMGAWQVYLLMTSPTLLPTFWHGGYIKRKFILKEEDMREIEPLKHFELSGLTKQGWLYPSVEIEHDSGTLKANIHCCYWNDWKGLVREHSEIKIHNGKVTSYKANDQFVVYKYDCGILF